MMKRKKSVGKHKWTRTDALLGAVGVVGGIIIGFMLNKSPILPRLEDNYSQWTYYDSFEDTDIAALAFQNIQESIDGSKLLLIDENSGWAKTYDVATKKVTATTDFAGTVTFYHLASVRGKYYVAEDFANFYVFKDCELIQTIDKTALGTTLGMTLNSFPVISFSGKFIVASGTFNATGNRGWLILKGS